MYQHNNYGPLSLVESMNVLLVNPNTDHTPVVIPVGLEYVASAVCKAGHRADILDLCFAQDPLGEIRQRIAAGQITGGQYDLIWVSIRNVDTGLCQNNEWSLGNIRELVRALKQAGVPVVIGGAGLLAGPEAMLDFVGGDYAIVGPAEGVIVQLMADIANRTANYRVLNGWLIEFDRLQCMSADMTSTIHSISPTADLSALKLRKGARTPAVIAWKPSPASSSDILTWSSRSSLTSYNRGITAFTWQIASLTSP